MRWRRLTISSQLLCVTNVVLKETSNPFTKTTERNSGCATGYCYHSELDVNANIYFSLLIANIQVYVPRRIALEDLLRLLALIVGFLDLMPGLELLLVLTVLRRRLQN